MAASIINTPIKNQQKLSVERVFRIAVTEFSNSPFYYIFFTAITLVLPVLFLNVSKSLPEFKLFFSFLLILINPALQLGTSAFFHQRLIANETKFNNFFLPFKKELIDLFVFTLISIVFAILVTLPLITTQQILEDTHVIVAGGSWPIWFSIMVLLTFLLLIYLSISVMFAPYFIYYFKLKPWAACKKSFEFIKPQWFWFFGFYLWLTLGVVLGFVALVIGLLVALPVVRIASYYVFSKYSGLDVFDEENERD
jgi:hypothetical protein